MKSLIILTVLIAITQPAFAHKAHVHGNGKVEVTMEVDKLDIDIDIPGDSIVGFETQPSTDKQKKAVDEALALLKDLAKVVTVDGGNCTVKENKAEVDYENGHSEFEVDLEFTCAKPLEVKSLTFVVMDTFKNLKQLEVVYVSKAKQDQKILKGKERTFSL